MTWGHEYKEPSVRLRNPRLDMILKEEMKVWLHNSLLHVMYMA